MKKTLFALLTLLFTASFATAQDEGAKLAKSAGKLLTRYYQDQSNNDASLKEAKEKIDQAVQMPDAQGLYTAWYTRGEVYSAIIQKEAAMKVLNPQAAFSGDNDALVSFESYNKAFDLATKKYEKSDAIKGVGTVYAYLVDIGVAKYEAGQYEKAFLSFQGSLKAHDLLKANNQKSIFDEKERYNNQLYITALSAWQAQRCADAIPLFKKLIEAGTDQPTAYEGLYTCTLESGDEAGAQAVLDEGRKKFPEDSGLLFAEINAYLKAGKLDELTGRLKTAIAKEPNNVGLYVTLGNVYDNLYQRELQAKNDAKANEYFEEAKKYYSQGVEKDPKNVDAVYSLGALYYNKAAIRTQELNAMPEDFSAAGIKKYDAIKNEINTLFDQALPYFQKAESLDANDLNTLIALNEIYARKEDETLSPEFKKRLDTVKGGGKNTKSYFKN
ncbi:MAG: hypothetical protein JNL02_18885 [Saprospiraceae bacterium]|nr:hypothetical protein [Saprospiraceae bacterium]